MDAVGPLIDAAPRMFFGVPSLRDLDELQSQVAFLGVPYDGGTPQPGIPTGQRAGLGFDVVELNPARDPSGATARVATWIITHFLSEIFDR